MKKRYRFTGKEKDNESGLYYMAARYYCSSTTKFLSVDPKAGETPQYSPYAYGNCNPIIFNDPSGMQPEKQNAKNEAGGKQNSTTGNTKVDNTKQQATQGSIYSWNKDSTEATEANKNLSTGNHSINVTTGVQIGESKNTPVENIETYSVIIEVNFEDVNGERVEFGVKTTFNDAPGAKGTIILARDFKTNEITEHVQVSGNAEIKPQKTFSEKVYDKMVEYDTKFNSLQSSNFLDKAGAQINVEGSLNLPGNSTSVSAKTGMYEYKEGYPLTEYELEVSNKQNVGSLVNLIEGKVITGEINAGFIFDFKGQSDSSSWFISISYRNIKLEYDSYEREIFLGISTERKNIDFGKK